MSTLTRMVVSAGGHTVELGPWRLLFNAFLAGIYIAIAGAFSIGMTVAGMPSIVGAVAFATGLILVVLTKASLFTGCNLTVSMTYLERRTSLLYMLSTCLFCWLGNLLGALLFASLIYQAAMPAAFIAKVSAVAVAKVTLPISVMLYRGILCNILVCLAVLLSIIATDTTGKILAIIFPVSAFVALGFEHCVANMFILPLALMYHASFSVGAMLINLGMVTLGNVLGGCLFVALPYFLIYGDRTGDNPYHRLD